MKAIQEELGDREGKQAEVTELKKRIETSDMPEQTRNVALKELGRYEKIPVASAESGVIRNYLDWLLSIPWSTTTKDRRDIHVAEKILNRDHEGLEEVKERILEYLSVQQLTNSLRGPILCLAGPPGVGKTSLAKSIAESLNRKFVRISLGECAMNLRFVGTEEPMLGLCLGVLFKG